MRAQLFTTLLELEEAGKMCLEPDEVHPDGRYQITQPMPLPERAWTD